MMYFVVIFSILLLVSTVYSQDGCTDAQAALATNSVCLELLDTLDDFNATSSASNPLCMDPCYTLYKNFGDECSQLQQFVS